MSIDDSVPAPREDTRVDRNTAQHRILQMVAREVVNRIRTQCGKSSDALFARQAGGAAKGNRPLRIQHGRNEGPGLDDRQLTGPVIGDGTIRVETLPCDIPISVQVTEPQRLADQPPAPDHAVEQPEHDAENRRGADADRDADPTR